MKLSAEEQVEVLRKVVAIMSSCHNTAVEMEEQQTNAMNVIRHLDCTEKEGPTMTWVRNSYKKYVEDRV